MLPIALAFLTALLVTGCGARRTPVPVPVRADDPKGMKAFRTSDVGFTFPSNWHLLHGKAPAVAHVFSGRAVLTIWAYRRNAVPRSRNQLETAQSNLEADVKQKNPGFQQSETRLVRVAGSPGVEVVGDGTINGQQVRIRSEHVFRGMGEYVIDSFAPPDQFERVDGEVFLAIVASLRLGGHPKPAGG